MSVDAKMAALDGKFDELVESVDDLWPKYQRGLRESFYRGFAAGVTAMMAVAAILWIVSRWV
jgi:hypothetical protein